MADRFCSLAGGPGGGRLAGRLAGKQASEILPLRCRHCGIITQRPYITSTYGHRSQRTEDPVRSPELKLRTGGLVVRWVTTCEYPLLYILLFGPDESLCFCSRQSRGDSQPDIVHVSALTSCKENKKWSPSNSMYCTFTLIRIQWTSYGSQVDSLTVGYSSSGKLWS